VGDKLFIYLLLNIGQKNSFINHVLEKKISNHHQNVIQFLKIQKFFIQINVHFWKKNTFNMYGIESTLRINF